MNRAATAAIVATVLAGCATASKDIAATYVSPLTYQGYTCEQLIGETQRIGARVAEVGGAVDAKASRDKKITGVGVVLFWPALFALGGNKEKQAEFARLKGEYDAVQQAAITKNCAAQQATQ